MTAISRRQAWCKLAVLIADGLPDPGEIRFSEGNHLMVSLDFADDLHAWAAALDVNLSTPSESNTPGQWLQSGYNWDWHGFTLGLWCSHASVRREAKPSDGMAAVRAVADKDLALGGGEVAGPDRAGSATTPAESSGGAS